MAVVELVPLLILILFLVLAISVLTSAFHGGRHRLPPSPLALPIIGHFHLVGPLIHQSFHKLSLRLGPIFSLHLGSVPCIVVSSPDLAKNFLKTHELSFISHVQSIAIERLTYNASLAFAPYGPYWRVIKKICTTEFLSSRSVSSFSSVRAREYRRLLRLLAEKAERCEAVNLTKELPKLSNNVIAKMMLGSSHSSDEQRDEEARLVTRQVTRIFGEFNLSDFVWFCKKLDLQGFGKRIEHTHRRFDALVEKVIVQREQLRNKNNKDINGGCCTLQRDAREEKVKDFLDILLDLLEDETAEVKLTRVHIKALIMDLFTAGTDSTAISLEWALAELINHPKVLKKAREEIHAVVGNRRLVLESDGPNLPYIHAIIKETFRLHPPVPLVSRNSVQECKIGKYVIPANTMLFVNVWAIGRDPKYWESPLEFRPERFLQLGGPNQKSVIDVRGQHFELMPFGTGRRICPGLNLAMQMIPGLLAAMIQCFDWKVIGSNPKNMKNDHDVLEMDELPGMISPRAHDLVCVPVARFSPLDILDT